MAFGHAQSKAMVKENAAVEVCSGTAVWYHTGLPVVPIRWVLVRDPQGKFKSQALLCTNQAYSPTQILEWFVRRWQMEVTFEEVRAHKGRGNPTAVVRFGNCPHNSLNVWAIIFSYDFGTPNTQANFSWTVRQTIWYSKPKPNLLRCTCFGSTVSMG